MDVVCDSIRKNKTDFKTVFKMIELVKSLDDDQRKLLQYIANLSSNGLENTQIFIHGLKKLAKHIVIADNIPPSIPESDLRELFPLAFVARLYHHTTVLKYTNLKDAKNAVKNYHNTCVNGYKLQVYLEGHNDALSASRYESDEELPGDSHHSDITKKELDDQLDEISYKVGRRMVHGV